MPEALPPIAIASVRRSLLQHDARHGRMLPWVGHTDPYAIWVSEVMLQQTQVATVVPRFVAFMQQYPSVAALAAATPESVCEAWAGLGYYRRARLLHQAAQRICQEHGGQMPRTVAQLMALPGIGRYTAGAIASMAFGVAAPIVDGNVERLLSRLYAQAVPRPSAASRAFFWERAAALAAGEHPGRVNQAMMDLGATICTPRTPRCDACPLLRFCRAHHLNQVHLFPAPKMRAKATAMAVAFAYLRHGRETWLVRRALGSSLWAGQWELPSAAGPAAPRQLAELLGVPLGPERVRVTHLLTHRRVTASVFVPVGVASPPPWPTGTTARAWADPLAAPLSALARRALQAVFADAEAAPLLAHVASA